MNRPIKFRAWDKFHRDMSEPFSFGADNSFIFKCNEHDEHAVPSDMLLMANPVQFEIMQFTGLEDKNGKEIYFGDYLKLSMLKGDLFSEVKLCEKRQVPVVEFFQDELIPEELHCYTSPDKDDSSVEIIGNVYENPELLK